MAANAILTTTSIEWFAPEEALPSIPQHHLGTDEIDRWHFREEVQGERHE